MNSTSINQLLATRAGQSAASYTDLNALQKIKLEEKDEALKQVAKQFESLFLNMMLKSMRQANATFEEGSLFSGGDSEFYRDMHDQQLALNISEKSGGAGLADVLYRQLQRQYGEASSPHIDPASFNLPQRNASLDRVSPSSATPALRSSDFATPEDFIDLLSPYAQKAAQELGLDEDWLLAQAALETGWGKKVVAGDKGEASHNLFNIKADKRWQGEAVSTQTHEYHNGLRTPERAEFRRYDSIADSFSDYVAFLQNNHRYQEALANTRDGKAFVEKLQQAGYATDPHYSDKIAAVYEQVVTIKAQPRETRGGADE